MKISLALLYVKRGLVIASAINVNTIFLYGAQLNKNRAVQKGIRNPFLQQPLDFVISDLSGKC